MGLSRSSVDVGYEIGRWKWSVDGARSMVMMAVVKMVISYHGFLSVGYYFVFGIFSFLWILVDGYGRYMILFFIFFIFR